MDFPQEIWVYFEQTDVASKYELIDTDHREGKPIGYYFSVVKLDNASLVVTKGQTEAVKFYDKTTHPFFTTFGECIDYRQSLLNGKVKQLALQLITKPQVIE